MTLVQLYGHLNIFCVSESDKTYIKIKFLTKEGKSKKSDVGSRKTNYDYGLLGHNDMKAVGYS
jgi:hypothetical protein